MRLAAIVVSLSVALAACGSANAVCVGIVDDVVEVFQEIVSAVDELDLAEVASAGDDFEFPGMAEIEGRAAALQAQADSEGCDDAELRELLTERIGRLQADTVFGQAVIEGIRQEGLFGDS